MDLTLIWFLLVGVLLIGYFVLDGFDFGVGMALPFLGKDNVDRRLIINTIGPVWDLNETWVIVAGACLFAAFPEWYATLFSGFYLPLLLILLALIARGVSFEYRHQRDDIRWKRRFDWMITIGSAVHVIPEPLSQIGHAEGYLEEKAKAIVLLMRLLPEQLPAEHLRPQRRADLPARRERGDGRAGQPAFRVHAGGSACTDGHHHR